MSALRTVSQMLLAAVFISGGSNTFMNPDGRAKKVEAAGVPMAREATMLNGAAMAVAGTALALDITPKLAALVLLGSLIPTTLVGHPFWQESDPALRANHQIHFLKNLAIMGGLLALLTAKDK